MKRIGRRLREPSTWAAIAALAALVHPAAGQVVGEVGPHVVAVVGGIAAIVGIVKPERGAHDAAPENQE
jgi:hypothetical protein